MTFGCTPRIASHAPHVCRRAWKSSCSPASLVGFRKSLASRLARSSGSRLTSASHNARAASTSAWSIKAAYLCGRLKAGASGTLVTGGFANRGPARRRCTAELSADSDAPFTLSVERHVRVNVPVRCLTVQTVTPDGGTTLYNLTSVEGKAQPFASHETEPLLLSAPAARYFALRFALVQFKQLYDTTRTTTAAGTQ